MVLKRKALRIIFAVLLIVGCVGSNILMASALNADTAATTTVDFAALGLDRMTAANSYTDYMEKHSKSEYSSESAPAVQLNGQSLAEPAEGKKAKPVEFKVNIEKDGLYYIGMSYMAVNDKQMDDIRIGLKIDGKYPHAGTEDLHFPRMWCDDTSAGAISADSKGNEYVPEQVLYEDYYYFEAYDEIVENTEKFMVFLTAGEHTVTLLPVKGSIKIEYFQFAATIPLEKYKAPSKSDYYEGDPIII